MPFHHYFDDEEKEADNFQMSEPVGHLFPICHTEILCSLTMYTKGYAKCNFNNNYTSAEVTLFLQSQSA